jgi:transcriptional regulator with XRE-family HTH domain
LLLHSTPRHVLFLWENAMVVEIAAKNRIRSLREQRGWTLRELAERASLPAATIAAAEIPQREPRRVTARRIAEALGIDVGEVYVD